MTATGPEKEVVHMGSTADGTVLRVTDLRTYFHTGQGIFRAVDGVDLTLRSGRTLGLVGESGSGKSLTAFSILRLTDRSARIQEGSRVEFGGRDLVSLSEKEMAAIRGRDISMIFQEPMTALNPVHRVGAQVAEPLRRHLGMRRREAAERAVELLDLVGIRDARARARDYPHQFSGGMLQRVVIAMALACEPRVLLADEPTTALDVTIQEQILTLLRRLQDRFATAVLLITHDLGVVAQSCDDVAVMYAGRVVETGPVARVFSAPRHPYTRALLATTPTLDSSAPLVPIPGTVPDSRHWPVGCRFAERCPSVMPRCRQEYPPMEGSGTARAACWLPVAFPRSAGTVETVAS
ncbi:ABC transporter ATP-binding protein [Streptosporangium sp. NPDC051022]|uniref:ABC transporter ATP-binding protein n=1 Tax=Streptosporangium sp. NPDC051022 TaxID=3155752 RepID=UPI003414C2B0